MRNVVRAFPFLLFPLLASCMKHTAPDAPINVSAYHTPIKVACVGDSITEGRGLGDNTYPEQLQRMLGESYQVRNFGVSGATLLERGDKPYRQQDLYKQSLAFYPDVVVIMLGTNDSKPQNWDFKSDFEKDYHHLVQQYQQLDSHPRIWLVYPCPIPNSNKFNIREAPVDMECGLIARTARFRKVGIIDVHSALVDHADLFPDSVHPNAAGATIMAGTVYQSLAGKTYKGPSSLKEATTNP